MDEKEMLEVEIQNLKNAYDKIQEVLKDLKDVDSLDEQYNQLYCIAENVNDRRIELEVKWGARYG